MIGDNSDISWERWGKEDPYYGVLTYDRFRRKNLNKAAKINFFETGQAHLERGLALLGQRFGSLRYESALDFGCGVGRIVIPLARIFERVTAVDVSCAMLEETAKNCREWDIRNVSFIRSDDELSKISGKFDFIHSYQVFQHIPARRGEKIIARLLHHLNDDGILAVQLPFLRKGSKVKRVVHFLRKNFKPLSIAANITCGKAWNEPLIQMNTYDLNRVSASLSNGGIKDVFMEVADAGGFLSAFVIARKPAKPDGKREESRPWAAKIDTI